MSEARLWEPSTATAWPDSCLAIPGIKEDRTPYLHSHMLGVLSDYRNAGVGRLLKSAQREDALARGIRLIEWSFDPFEAKNAYFNLEMLGAIVRRVRSQSCTASRKSPLHGDLPTDRCIAEWWMLVENRANDSHCRARFPAPAENPRIARDARPRVRAAFCRWISRDRLRTLHAEQSGDTDLFVIAMAIQIEKIILREIAMPLVHFFETSFGRTYAPQDHPGGGRQPEAFPDGARSPAAKILSTTKSGPMRPG